MSRKSLMELRKKMRGVMQFEDQSVLDHGVAVARYFKDIHDHFMCGTKLKYEWKLPEWISSRLLWDSLAPLRDLYLYQIYHDCGKLQFDDLGGAKKFPNHAIRSSEMWRAMGGGDLVAGMMSHDMDIHLMAADEMEEFIDLPYAASLILTGLSEIHANSKGFGGIQSVSFKSKWKQIDRRAKKFINLTTNKEGKI
jgi:hypothetical protein